MDLLLDKLVPSTMADTQIERNELVEVAEFDLALIGGGIADVVF